MAVLVSVCFGDAVESTVVPIVVFDWVLWLFARDVDCKDICVYY